jgi:hypothetical protein
VSGGYRVGPDGVIGPDGGGWEEGDPVALGPGPDGALGWPPAVQLGPARAAWLARVGQVQAAHALTVSAYAAFSRAAAVLADAVEGERRAFAAYRAAAGH